VSRSGHQVVGFPHHGGDATVCETIITDVPFEQEVCTFFNRHHGLGFSDTPDVVVASDGTVWAANRLGLARFRGEGWEIVRNPAGQAGGNTLRLAEGPDGSLWVGATTGVSRLRNGEWEHWYGPAAPTRAILDLAPDEAGGVWALMSHEGDLNSRDIWHLDGREWQWWALGLGPRMQPVSIAVGEKGRPYIVAGGKVLRLTGKRWTAVRLGIGKAKARSVTRGPDGALWVGTTEGVVVLRGGKRAESVGKAEGLPVKGVSRVAFAPNGDVWFCHGVAASRRRGSNPFDRLTAPSAAEGWRYYSPHTWFPSGSLYSLAVGPEGTVWFATPEGVARLETKKMTLAEKADIFERQMAEMHVRHGYVVERMYAEADDPSAEWYFHVTDNDGSHTAQVCASESFRYAVTKDASARRLARETLEACMRLVRLPQKRGFLARAAYRKDDPKVAAVPGEWHESSDGQWVWKGDTSSDELDGHMFAYGVYYDLVADEREKKEIGALVSDLIGGIVDNGYILEDMDGKHTRWGIWAPELLHSEKWAAQCKLNSLEALSFLRSALHMTGDKRFADAYDDLVENHGYAETVRTNQLATEPWSFSKFDDLLAAHAYYPLLMYEDNPNLRAIYADSLDRFWQFVRPERTPLYTVLVNALLDRRVDLEVIHEALAGHRLDTRHRTVNNELRQDVEFHTINGRKMVTKALRSAERAHFQWNRNPYVAHRQGWPTRLNYPTSYLRVYWMARYHGLIEAP